MQFSLSLLSSSIAPKEGVWTFTSLGVHSLSEGIATRQSVPTESHSVYNSPPPALNWISMAPECHSVTVAWHLRSAEPVSSFVFRVLWHPFSLTVPRPSQCLSSAKTFSSLWCLFGAMSLKGSSKCPFSRWQSFTHSLPISDYKLFLRQSVSKANTPASSPHSYFFLNSEPWPHLQNSCLRKFDIHPPVKASFG